MDEAVEARPAVGVARAEQGEVVQGVDGGLEGVERGDAEAMMVGCPIIC